MTKLALLNYFVQFLFIRVFKNVEKGETVNYGILYWVLPLTGWWNNYIVLTKNKKLKFWHWI